MVTIRSLEEQEFFSNLLFKTHNVVDDVWIGAKNDSNWAKFKWADYSDLSFTNWQVGNPSNKTNYDCVQIMPESSPMGKWANEPCNKKNLVVCQKMQNWSIYRLQNILLEVRKELKETQQQLNLQHMSPIPIGFIYTQLPDQPDPKTLWSTVEWKDVTSDYAGLFFRAEGRGSATYGQIQEENSPRITDVNYMSSNFSNPVKLLDPGWSSTVYTGDHVKDPDTRDVQYGLRFMVTSGEVRPRNQAMRIWKRIK